MFNIQYPIQCSECTNQLNSEDDCYLDTPANSTQDLLENVLCNSCAQNHGII